jgi:hypothetical protein
MKFRIFQKNKKTHTFHIPNVQVLVTSLLISISLVSICFQATGFSPVFILLEFAVMGDDDVVEVGPPVPNSLLLNVRSNHLPRISSSKHFFRAGGEERQ